MELEIFENYNASNILKDILKEQNIFVDPYQLTYSKIIAIVCYIINIFNTKVIYSFITNEAQDVNKTIINILVVFSYFLVSIHIPYRRK